MPLPVSQCRRFRGIGIAVFTKMGAGVILPDVLGSHAATRQALAWVFLMPAYEIPISRQWYGTGRQQAVIKQAVRGYFFDFDPHVLHQRLVLPSQAGDEVGIDATVMSYAIPGKLHLFTASRQGIIPTIRLVQLGKAFCKFNHLPFRPFPVTYPALV